MIFVRWSAPSRTIHSPEVNGLFDEETERILLFAFETDRMSVDAHAGHLSLKLLASGGERYHLGNRTITLDPSRILFLNAGQRYSSSIDVRRTRSVSFFLPPADVCSAISSLSRSDVALLDRPDADQVDPELPQVPFRPDALLGTLASRLVSVTLGARARSLPELEELVMQVAGRALTASLGLTSLARGARAVRRSTRDELMSRALRARDLIEDRRGRVSLSEMSHVACLSKFHFLRVFRSIFGCTPAAYARSVRLSAALAELDCGALPHRAAVHARYSSPSTLRRALRQHEARLARATCGSTPLFS